MEKGSTVFLRGVICVIGLAVLAICLFALPRAIALELAGDADFDYGIIFAGLCVPAIPFFIALHQAMKLLGYIDRNKAFSDLSVVALKKIKYCAFVISGLFAAGMPYIFYVAERDDAGCSLDRRDHYFCVTRDWDICSSAPEASQKCH